MRPLLPVPAAQGRKHVLVRTARTLQQPMPPPQPADGNEEDALLGGDRDEEPDEQLQQASCIKQYTVAL